MRCARQRRCVGITLCCLVGRIAIVGPPVIEEARIEAQLDGGEVQGVLAGAGERQIGTFTGVSHSRLRACSDPSLPLDAGSLVWTRLTTRLTVLP